MLFQFVQAYGNKCYAGCEVREEDNKIPVLVFLDETFSEYDLPKNAIVHACLRFYVKDFFVHRFHVESNVVLCFTEGRRVVYILSADEKKIQRWLRQRGFTEKFVLI